jgi:prepilin-type N-terminal cleavage/methylation domain-containing protein
MKKLFNNNLEKGFTLVETMVVIFVFGIVASGTTLMLKNIFVNVRQQSMSMDNVDLARKAANNFVNEMRNASYGANGAYPINQAGDTQIIFFSTAPKGNGTVSRVRYYISGSTLLKGIIDPTGTPGTYNTANEVITTVLKNLSLGSNPLFYYYDGNYSGSGNALTQQVNINLVKFVKINLTVLKQISPNNNSTFTVNAGGAIRNIKTNLGN